MDTTVQTKQLLWLNCRLSLNTGWLVMHSLHLIHLREIADVSHHAIAIKA